MNAYELAKERYAALGIDTEKVIETLKNIKKPRNRGLSLKSLYFLRGFLSLGFSFP